MALEFGSDFEERIVASAAQDSDGAEASLRPETLEEYDGQERSKENLRIFIEAAKFRGEP